jgi:predicted RNase H-like nuclease
MEKQLKEMTDLVRALMEAQRVTHAELLAFRTENRAKLQEHDQRLEAIEDKLDHVVEKWVAPHPQKDGAF